MQTLTKSHTLVYRSLSIARCSGESPPQSRRKDIGVPCGILARTQPDQPICPEQLPHVTTSVKLLHSKLRCALSSSPGAERVTFSQPLKFFFEFPRLAQSCTAVLRGSISQRLLQLATSIVRFIHGHSSSAGFSRASRESPECERSSDRWESEVSDGAEEMRATAPSLSFVEYIAEIAMGRYSPHINRPLCPTSFSPCLCRGSTSLFTTSLRAKAV
ncbi:hypothetical protein BU25DRAFT_204623 [Macroventuria anomochaeta]|uniref:Uncharacterized protein n=1 Tax=Macroventuria anomochaeta TaxID=301207 RepID=A0ACB6RN26_9PLEO|nr:uncharacterized protein BU25DRAFT_204623 [Macroventuria anomochaeta]KAF2622707.1 hypothetical protein BU25DRAFT_204623 [Macroventuria anomochaeta]